MYRTVNSFLDIGEVSDSKISGSPHVIRTPQVIKAVRLRINRNLVRKQENHGSGN